MRTSRRYSRKRRDGFTLIESLIIIMYIAIMAAMVLPNMTGAARRAAEANLMATVHELRAAIGSYQAETGVYPAQLADLVTNTAPDVGLTPGGVEVPIHPDDFRGPYLIPSGGRLPVDHTTGERTWDYSTTPPNVGAVRSLNTNEDLDGVPYSDY
jgi:type II secretory pathway pseudopilin PulG